MNRETDIVSLLNNIFLNVKKRVKFTNNIRDLESIRIELLGKKGILRKKKDDIKNLQCHSKEKFYLAFHKYYTLIKNCIFEKKKFLEKLNLRNKIFSERIDVSLPGRKINLGGLHPISITISKIENFFKSIGFKSVNSREVENKYYNFDALNIKDYHPVYNDHDTFWFNSDMLLRSQTSSIQMHIIKKNRPPIQVITCGKVYRRDYDYMHTPMFHQIEGLFIDQNLSFSDLKSILFSFLKSFFIDRNVKIRFRPSYFPFTEPSGEIDIMFKGCSWIEILGCGMVHPKILEDGGIDHKYSGMAFGIGVERLSMLLYNINDLRILFENDLSFLKQFN